METRASRRVLHPAMLPWIGAGEPVPPGGEGWTSLLGADLWRAGETTEARSVVASSLVPRGERGVPVSLPAAGPVVRKKPSSGGWRASCPATYRPTRGHRHVRIWAIGDIRLFAVIHKRFLACGGEIAKNLCRKLARKESLQNIARGNARPQRRDVKGSMRMPARMKAPMIAMPITKNSTCRM